MQTVQILIFFTTFVALSDILEKVQTEKYFHWKRLKIPAIASCWSLDPIR